MRPSESGRDVRSTLSLIGNVLGLALYLGGAALMLLTGLVNLLLPASSSDPATGMYILLACGLGMCGLVFVPASLFSLRRFNGRSLAPVRLRAVKDWEAVLIGCAWLGASLLADFLNNRFSLGWLAAVPFFLFAIGLPILLLVWIGIGRLELGSANRLWSTLTVGMTVGPFLALVLEAFVYAGVFLAGILVVALSPAAQATVRSLTAQLSGMTDMNAMLNVLAPYLLNPVIVAALFLVLSVFTPLIEETVKPTLVWLMAGRLESPVQGFALGVLSGAGFALGESLLASSTPGQGWGGLLIARAGGGLMHVLASGLMGWGIVSARQGKPLRLVATYLISLTIHGLWNGAAVLSQIGAAREAVLHPNASGSDPLTLAGTLILYCMVVVILPALIWINRRLRSTEPPALPSAD